MSLAVLFTPAAETDLDDIWFAIALESPAAADRLIDKIRDRTKALSEFPNLGLARPDISKELRMLIEGNYLVLYRAEPNQVEIIRVVHGARDLAALF